MDVRRLSISMLGLLAFIGCALDSEDSPTKAALPISRPISADLRATCQEWPAQKVTIRNAQAELVIRGVDNSYAWRLSGSIFDSTGDLIRGWESRMSYPGQMGSPTSDLHISWNGTDKPGHQAPPGFYFWFYRILNEHGASLHADSVCIRLPMIP